LKVHATAPAAPPGTTRPPNPNHEERPAHAKKRGIHGKNNLTPSVANQTPRRIDEVVLNALAFSTLLSSQETDAHHQDRSRVPSGATTKLYPVDPLVSTRVPEVPTRWCEPPGRGASWRSPRRLRLYPRLADDANRTTESDKLRKSQAV
jgi:hypothetical protein